MFNSLDISTSGLIAQRTRLEVTSANLANRYSITDAQGNYSPFRRRMAILSTGDPSTGSSEGVHVRTIEQDQSDFRKVYEPGHRFADKDGNVNYPNIDPAMEMINALDASRAYEANITATEATKAMIQSSLRLLA
ncbi:MAG: flagellar basal body rod protein FlgC [Phycisphaeraceae bacterium]